MSELRIGLLVTNPPDRRLVAELFESLGYSVDCAHGVRDLTNVAEALGIVLTDDYNGARFARQLTELKQSAAPHVLPILVMSRRTSDGAMWLRAGFDDVLHMPLAKIELQTRVEAFLRRRSLSSHSLAVSRKRFEATFDQAPSGIAHIRPDGRILLVNRRFAEMVGSAPQELRNREISSLFHPVEVQAVTAQREAMFKAKDSKPLMGINRMCRHDGSAFWGQITASRVTGSGEEESYGIVIVTDVTEQRLLDEKLRRAIRARTVMAECNRILVHAECEDELLREMCQTVTTLGGYRMAWLGLVDDRGSTVTPVAFAGYEAHYLDHLRIELNEVDGPQQGPTARAIRTKRPVVVSSIERDYSFGPWREQAILRGYGAVLVVPLVAKERALGILAIYSAEPDTFTQAEIDLLEELGLDVAYGLESLRTSTERERALTSLKDSERFARSTLDALTEHICVLNESGRVIALNSAWRDLATKCAAHFSAASEGANYLECCDRAALFGDALAGQVASKLREVILGSRSGFSCECSCEAKGTVHWFRLRATRFSTAGPVRVVISLEDITDYHNATTALRETEQQFRQLAENVQELFWIFDVRKRRFIYLSPAFERVWGRPRDDRVSDPATLFKWIHPDDRERIRALTKKVAANNLKGRDTSIDEEYRILLPNGDVRWVQSTGFSVPNEEGLIFRVVGITADRTERHAYEERLLQLAHFDSLTNLPNRALFLDRLKQALAQSKRNKWLSSIILLDLDRFKTVNDTLGHSAGDRLLTQVADRLNSAIRTGDTVSRLGGDEFAVIASNLHGAEDAQVVAEKILSAFETPFVVEGKELFVTASIGIALTPHDGKDTESLVRNADAAMYRAKQRGANGFQFYSAEINAQASARLNIESGLRRALERKEFFLVYQPKVDLRSERIVGAEALLRWNHPDGSVVSPVHFIPILEETGMIVPVGQWILETVASQTADWIRAGLNPGRVAVNLSAKQLRQSDLTRTLVALTRTYGIPAEALELEITETSLMENVDRVATLLGEVHDLGFALAIDDFGTGYSSLNYLKRFRTDTLKIDRSFVDGVLSDTDDAAITQTIITIAHKLGMKVIAEGVEEEGQRQFLIESGCDEGQGYLWSAPVAVGRFEEMIAEGAAR